MNSSLDTSILESALPPRQVNSGHSLISWRSVVAGLVVAIITYMGLITLGIGLGGSTASVLAKNSLGSTSGFSIGASVWIGLSVLFSLSAGSYFSARTSTFTASRMGAAHGVIITSLFFGLMLYGFGQTIGLGDNGLSRVMSTFAVNTNGLSTNLLLQNSVENSLGNISLRSDSTVVAKGLLSRLVMNDPASAKSYLSIQSGLAGENLDSRFSNIETEFNTQAQSIMASATSLLSKTSWMLYWMLIVGLGFAMLSGVAGTRTHNKKIIPKKEKLVKDFSKTRTVPVV